MAEIRHVTMEDMGFWYSLDRHLPETEFGEKVRHKQGYVLRVKAEPAGLLRYNLFWDNTPFCTMVFVDGRFQGRGYGPLGAGDEIHRVWHGSDFYPG